MTIAAACLPACLLAYRLNNSIQCCRYEGLTREDAPTLRGTLVLGHGLGGGLQQAQRGDK